jgi:hypothetical protein
MRRAVLYISLVLCACGPAGAIGDPYGGAPRPKLKDAGSVVEDAGTNPPPAASDAGTGPTSPTPSQAGFPLCTPDTWSNAAQGFFTANCSSCHATYTALGGVELDATRIKNDLISRRMPTDHQLSDGDIARMSRWLECDLPP